MPRRLSYPHTFGNAIFSPFLVGLPDSGLVQSAPCRYTPAMLQWLANLRQGISAWALLLMLVLLWGGHGTLTLRLFGSTPEEIWQGLTDERPLLAGRHALHFCQGIQGADHWWTHLSVEGYDPAFQAGCPKSPWFDSGSRPAEVFAYLGGSSPAAYKLGVAASWMLFPMLIWWGASCLRWGWPARNATLALTLVLCWSPWGLERLTGGDMALILATGCLLLTVTQMPRLQDAPHWRHWCGICLSMSLTLFWLPFMGFCLLPAVVLFYALIGSHRPWRWHLAFSAAVIAAIVVNWPWLSALKEYCWLLSERSTAVMTNIPATQGTCLTATGTLSLVARLLFLLLLAGGACGLVLSRRSQQGNLLALLAAMSAAWALAMLGPLWEGCAALETERFAFAMLVLAALPTTQAIIAVRGLLAQRVPARWLWLGSASLLLLLELGLGLHREVRELLKGSWGMPRLALGLAKEHEECMARLREMTNTEARILWEDTTATESWSPLLPLHTHRAFVGGLGPGPTEHARLRWANGLFAGRPLHEWTEKEMNDFCTRHNIGWVVSRSPKGTHFWREHSAASRVMVLPDGGTLFALQRRPSFFLLGQGRITHCDGQRLTLEDLQPEQGRIVLSFHHHDRMQATDHRIHIERADPSGGPLPLLQLRLAGPVARVTILW
jgi:hypothetical protein